MSIKTDGALWTWGKGNYGQLGHNNRSYISSPQQVGALTTWSLASGGTNFTAVLKTDGTLWTWGINSQGSLGLGNTTSYSSPVQVGSSTNWSAPSAGSIHALAINTV